MTLLIYECVLLVFVRKEHDFDDFFAIMWATWV